MSALDASTTAALQLALAGEHAAVWGYGQIGAKAVAANLGDLAAAQQVHRVRRDAVVAILLAQNATPVASAASYTLPAAITDAPSGLKVAATIEDNIAANWRYVLGETDDSTTRQFALAALIDAATRAMHWRITAGAPAPVTTAFPGM